MKIQTWLLIALCTGVVAASPKDVSATFMSLEKGTVTIASGDVVNDDLVIGAEHVVISGTVNGDVFAGGATVRVDGTINGDLHAGGATVTVTGSVRDDAYLGGGTITLAGADIGDSLLVGGGNVRIDADSKIGGSLFAGSGMIENDAPVARNAYIGAGMVVMNNSVGGEMRTGAGEIRFGPKTRILKDLTYILDPDSGDLTLTDGATVSGAVVRLQTEYMRPENVELVKKQTFRAFQTAGVVARIVFAIGAFIVGYIFITLFPKTAHDAAKLASDSMPASAFIGFLIMVGAIPALFITALTGIGLPLAAVMFLVFLIHIHLATIVASSALGSRMLALFGVKRATAFAGLAAGLAVVYAIGPIPFFGMVFWCIVTVTGLGALVRYYAAMYASRK